MNNTTRRFPRTLQQAFPHDREWAYALEIHRRPTHLAERLIGWASIGGCVALVVWTILAWAAQ